MNRFLHYGAEHLTEVWSIPAKDQSTAWKPKGLWISIEGDDDWKEWCTSNDFGNLDCVTEIKLQPNANIFWVEGPKELDRFHEKFGVLLHARLEFKFTPINWSAVAQKFHGIIIAPYIWSRRYESPVSDWYYAWDCASGCIWNKDAIAEIKSLVTETSKERQKNEHGRRIR